MSGQGLAEAADEDEEVARLDDALLQSGLFGGGHGGEGVGEAVEQEHAGTPGDGEGLAGVGAVGDGEEVAAGAVLRHEAGAGAGAGAGEEEPVEGEYKEV